MTGVEAAQFRWLTPASGHEWKRLRLIPKSGGSRWIAPNAPAGAWIYAPPPGLFREFAQLAVGNDAARLQIAGDAQRKAADDRARRAAILAFADEYGDILAQPQEGGLSITTDVKVVRKHATMETWYSAVRQMRKAVDLWDLFNDSKGDKARPLPEELRHEIKRALTDTDTPSCATPTLTPQMSLVVYPVNLLAFMWLTFARVATGRIEERRCEMFESCHEHIYIGSGPGLGRGDKTICSAACRKEKSRKEIRGRANGTP